MTRASDFDENLGPDKQPLKDWTVSFPLQASASDPNLLLGLQSLWQLGLISEEQVKQVAGEQLCCPLPLPERRSKPQSISSSRLNAVEAAASLPVPATDSEQRSADNSPLPAPTHRWFQSVMDEISVLWLLFLGVFLVVLSSAVLAASQWQNVSAVGQYSILLIYTLAFWGAGEWTAKQEKLRLTAQMLQRVTLLLVPINFWAMDGLRLWQLPLGWLVGSGAAIALTFILVSLLKSRVTRLENSPPTKQQTLNLIALSWLHWGWAVTIWPLLATYIGMVGTAIATLYANDEPISDKKDTDENDSDENNQNKDTEVRGGLSSATFITLLGALLLLARALLVAQVPLEQLGLAFGICGAILAWRSRQSATRGLWGAIGAALLALGWLIPLQMVFPWQSVVVSGLALGILAERLNRLRLPFDLTLFFGVGLQVIWLVRRLVPEALRDGLLEQVEAIAGSNGMPLALVGVTLFPYLLLFVGIGEWFRQQRDARLSRQVNILLLLLGATLTALSWGNDLTRPLNCTLSALTLGSIMSRRNLASPLWPHLTQLLFWGAVLSWIGLCFPALSDAGWFGLLLIGMLLEWAIALGWFNHILGWVNRPASWRQSAWHAGLILSALSYLLSLDPILYEASRGWAVAWWTVPLALAAIATQSHRLEFTTPAAIHTAGTLALFAGQCLVLTFPAYRLVGLGLATLLMGWHSRQWPRLWTAAIAIGFGIAFSFVVAFRGRPEWAEPQQWLFAGAAIALILWSIWGGLRTRAGALKTLYARATSRWAIALFVPILLLLVVYSVDLYNAELFYSAISPAQTIVGLPEARLSSPSMWMLGASGLTSLSMLLCAWCSRSSIALLGLAVAVEMLLSLVIAASGAPLGFPVEAWIRGLAIANLGLALVIQQIGTRRKPREGQNSGLDKRRFIPTGVGIGLGYGVFGAWLGHFPFDGWTGALTIAASGIVLNLSRRSFRGNEVVCGLGLLGFSWGAYELLVYQLSQGRGGNPGDGLVLLALLGAILALVEWGLRHWFASVLPLREKALRILAHGHWAIATVLASLALLIPTSTPGQGPLGPTGGLFWILTVTILGLYGILQDREEAAGWNDIGLVQLLSALGYGIHLIFPWAWLLGWAAAIACPIAACLYRLPWQRFGYSQQPGRRWATIVPIALVILTAWDITTQSLLIVAAFYAGLAALQTSHRAIRLSYLTVGLLNWAMLRIFNQFGFSALLWYAGLLGATVLYVAEIDPELCIPAQREIRHKLRCLGSSIVCFAGLYQGQVGLGSLEGFGAGLVAIAFSFAFILAGMTLRIRAFLFVGTLAFLLQVLLQVWQFIQDESLLLWALGIGLGLVLIWIAATFEARRSQVIALLDRWATELDAWQ